MKRRTVAAGVVTAAALVALAGSVAASSGDDGWTAYTPDHDGRIVVVAGGAGEDHAALTADEAESRGYGWTGYDPYGTRRACKIFRASDAVELPGMGQLIADNAEHGQDAGVRGAARAMADWVDAHDQVDPVPAPLVSAMRTACYAFESSPAAVSGALADSGGHSYEGL